jgi:hypothetical protein
LFGPINIELIAGVLQCKAKVINNIGMQDKWIAEEGCVHHIQKQKGIKRL